MSSNLTQFKLGHIPWHKGKILRFYEPKPCLECGNLMNKPRPYSPKQWQAKKYCDFKCWGRQQSKKLKNKPSFFKGKRHTVEAKRKNGLAHIKPNAITRLFKKEYYNLKSLERYARHKQAEGRFTLEEWNQLLCKHQYKCVYCGYQGKLTKDHIIPLTKGGSNYITNMQPLCQSCNSRKGNR